MAAEFAAAMAAMTRVGEQASAAFAAREAELSGRADAVRADADELAANQRALLAAQEELRRDREALQAEKASMIGRCAGMADVIELSVGGAPFTTFRSTLMRFEESMMGRMFSGRWELPKDSAGRSVIDRPGGPFGAILDWLRTDYLALPEEPPARKLLLRELHFYGLLEYATGFRSREGIVTRYEIRRLIEGFVERCAGLPRPDLLVPGDARWKAGSVMLIPEIPADVSASFSALFSRWWKGIVIMPLLATKKSPWVVNADDGIRNAHTAINVSARRFGKEHGATLDVPAGVKVVDVELEAFNTERDNRGRIWHALSVRFADIFAAIEDCWGAGGFCVVIDDDGRGCSVAVVTAYMLHVCPRLSYDDVFQLVARRRRVAARDFDEELRAFAAARRPIELSTDDADAL